MSGSAGRHSDLATWVLFLLSSLFFIVSAMRSGDLPGLIGALLFFIACVVYLFSRSRRGAVDAAPNEH